MYASALHRFQTSLNVLEIKTIKTGSWPAWPRWEIQPEGHYTRTRYFGFANPPQWRSRRHAEEKGLKLRPDWRESLHPDHAGGDRRSDQHIWRLGAKGRHIPDAAKIH